MDIDEVKGHKRGTGSVTGAEMIGWIAAAISAAIGIAALAIAWRW